MIRVVSTPYVISSDKGKEVVILDVPLFIRCLEFVRENIKTDDELHKLVHEILKTNRKKAILSMKHFEEIVEEFKESLVVQTVGLA